MENPHRPVDGESTAQLLFIKLELPIRTDLDDTGESLIGKRTADDFFECRPAFYLLEKVECILDGHEIRIAYFSMLINRNALSHAL